MGLMKHLWILLITWKLINECYFFTQKCKESLWETVIKLSLSNKCIHCDSLKTCKGCWYIYFGLVKLHVTRHIKFWLWNCSLLNIQTTFSNSVVYQKRTLWGYRVAYKEEREQIFEINKLTRLKTRIIIRFPQVNIFWRTCGREVEPQDYQEEIQVEARVGIEREASRLQF